MENVMNNNLPNAGQAEIADTAEDHQTSKPSQVFNYIDNLDQNLENYEARLTKMLTFLAGNRPPRKEDEKVAPALHGGGLFDSMLGRHQCLARKSDQIYGLFMEIESELGME
jgi:hypothetical protein